MFETNPSAMVCICLDLRRKKNKRKERKEEQDLFVRKAI